MKTVTLTSLLSAVVALPVLASASASYTLLHRVSSHTSTPEWTERGLLDLSNGTTMTNTLTDAEVESLHAQALADDAAGLFYQVALRQEGSGNEEGLWTSVRLCHLRQSAAELRQIDDEVTLTVREGGEVVGLGYRVRDVVVGEDGCPVQNGAKLAKVKEEERRQRQLARRRSAKSNPAAPTSPSSEAVTFSTLVHLQHPRKAHKPTLKQAAATNSDGTVVQSPPEKSFLQKYWMYMIPVVLLLIMPDGGDDGKDKGAEAHASSEHRGQGMGAKRLK